MDYRKLIGDLRLASRGPNGFGICAKAADAIEALMAENARIETLLVERDALAAALANDETNELRFIKALRFYAGGSHYDYNPVEDGLTARKALEPVRQETLAYLKP